MVDVSHGLGMPFGGIGTGFSVFGKYGFVDVYFDGRPLNGRDWRIDQPPTEKPSFAFQLTEGGKSTVLQETPVDWLANAQPVDKVQAYADLPKGHFIFEKAGSDLGLVMTGFSPMVPHDLTNSTIPVQVFDVTVENKANKARAFELSLLHRDALVVRGNKAVLITPNGETAFACDGGAADTHGVSESLKLAPGKRQTIASTSPGIIPPPEPLPLRHARRTGGIIPSGSRTRKQVIDLAMKSAGQWSAAIDRWHAAYDVPPAFKRLWFSALCSVSTSTILTADPYFFEQEVSAWLGEHHGRQRLSQLAVSDQLAEIERMDMDQYYQSIPRTGKDAGLVWHSLWNDSSDYAEEPTFIGRVYRDSLWFNDADWTAKEFPVATLAANHVYQTDNYRYLNPQPRRQPVLRHLEDARRQFLRSV